MKKVFDYIVLGLFYILCLLAFFLLIAYLPNELNNLLDTKIFENTHVLLFFVCLFIIGYVIMYYNNKEAEEERQDILDKVADTEYIPQSKINELAQ